MNPLLAAMSAIAFNAATPATWSTIFGISSLDDVRRVLSGWTSQVEYDGRRAWPGWFTDQQILHRALTSWPEAANRWWAMDDEYTRYHRLDKLELEQEEGLEPHRREAIGRGAYSDYVCLFPYRSHREVNDLVLELGIAAAQGR